MSKANAHLGNRLSLDRCPHCGIAEPHLQRIFEEFHAVDSENNAGQWWAVYQCWTCGKPVLASSNEKAGLIDKLLPKTLKVDHIVPAKPRRFLQEAIESIHTPSGSLMLAASAVDAMLKEKGYKEGTLHDRIDKAVEDNLIVKEMGKWAHKVRFDSNIPRHVKEDYEFPSPDDAQRSIDFALTLSEVLFVLPNRVQEGIKKAGPPLASKRKAN